MTTLFASINISQAFTTDIDDIMQIEKESFYTGILESKETFLERIEVYNEGFLVLKENNNKIIGYICSELWSNNVLLAENTFRLGHSIKAIHNNNGKRLYISSMGIAANYRGHGFGKLLFNHLINTISSEVKDIILVVGSKWENAIKIYSNTGFYEVKRIKDFFKPTDNDSFDGIIMKKDL